MTSMIDTAPNWIRHTKELAAAIPRPRTQAELAARLEAQKAAGFDEGLLSFCLPILVYMENPCKMNKWK
jgi:hypothetical protein